MIRRPGDSLCSDKMTTAILLVAVLGCLHAKRFFLAEAHGVKTVRRETERNEVLLDGAGTAIAEGKVVFGRATLIAVTFNGDLDLRIVPQELSGFGESVAGIRANVCFVEIEVGVAHFLQKEFVHGRFVLRCSRRANGDSGAGSSRAAGTARGNGVARRV